MLTLGSGYLFFLYIIIGSLLFIKLLRYLSDWGFARKNGCGKARHVPSWCLGLDHLRDLLQAMKENEALEFVDRWHHEYGHTFKMRLGRTVVQTIDPENVRAILADRFQDFDLGSRNDAMKPLLGEGIFASDGPVWAHSRALLRPNFARNQVSDIAVYEKHVAQLINNIPVDGSTIDLQDLFFRMTMDSATEFLFGKSVDTLSSGSDSATNSFAQNFAKNFQTSQAGVILRIRLGPLKIFHRDRAFTDATNLSRNYVRQIVKEAVANRACESGQPTKIADQSYVFLHELIKQTQDETILTDQLLNILLAGRDTTAGLLSILFLIMAKRNDLWCKLREEVLKLEGRRPSFEDLKSMTYLTWVLNETLRLYPVVPLNMRVANKNTVLPAGGGSCGTLPIFIPKGQEVLYSSYSMHRLPEVFGENASEYRPERWAGLKPGWAYVPFNGGPRICIGQQFALTEAGYATVRILQEFECLESRDPEPFRESLQLTLASKNGTKVGLKPVQS